MSLHLNLSAETKAILLLLVNIGKSRVQVLLADKVKKQLQVLATTFEFLVAVCQKAGI